MNEIVTGVNLPAPGTRWTIGETTVVVNDVSKRGRGYQVHIRIEGQEENPMSLRLKDFNKKATAIND
jgi:hypothetical protein